MEHNNPASHPQAGGYFHPFRPDHGAHPYEVLKQTREQCPVHQFIPGHYFLANDSDVRTALASSQLSCAGNFEMKTTGDPPTIAQRDGEQHRTLRTLLESSLNAQAYKNAQPFVEQKVRTLLQELLSSADHQADLTLFAKGLSGGTLAYVLGIPEAEIVQVLQWLAAIIAIAPGDFTVLDEWRSMNEYIYQLMDRYRQSSNPPDTIIRRLVEEEARGKLDRKEVKVTVFQLLGAGSDTTTMLIGSMFYELLRVPERWERVKENPSLVFNAVEEALRLHPPLNWVMRACPVDSSFEAHGQQIPAGSRVFIGLHSANRDEATWGANAEEFDLYRQGAARHVTFGQGSHFCLAAELARLQARVALTILAKERPSLCLQPGYQYQPLPGPMIHGPMTLPVSW